MEKIFVKNRKNQKLAAFFHKPERQTKKIIIFTHSFKGDKDYEPIIGEFSEEMCSRGYAVIRFDCWGTGESDGKFEDSSIRTQIEDLEDIIRYVRSQGYTDICLAGLSLGTSDSIMAYDDTIRCMVLWSPVFWHDRMYKKHRDETLQKGFFTSKRLLTGEVVRSGKAMWQDFKDIKPYKKLRDIRCPVLAIVGSKDDYNSEEKVKEFMNMIPSENRLEIIQGGDHNFLSMDARKKAICLSADFIKAHL